MKKTAAVLSVLSAAAVLLSGCSGCGGSGGQEAPQNHTHEYPETWQTVISATCQREGKRERTCKYCSNTIEQVIPKTDHDLGNWLADETMHWRECSMCRQKFVDTQQMGPAMHSFATGSTLCRVCGYDSAGTPGLVFEPSGDKSYYVVKDMQDVTAETIVVPETYCMLPVRSILDTAFEDCTAVTSIVLPSGITYIGNGAFSDCTSLSSITVSEKNTSFRSQDGILYNRDMSAYVHVPAKVSGNVKVPATITELGGSVFAGRAISGIELPAGLLSIGEMAFSGCTQLTELTVPSTVKEIGRNAFADCTSLQSLTLPMMSSSKVSLPEEQSGSSPQGNTFIGYLFGAQTLYGLENTVPASLKEVRFTGGERLDRYTFYRCSNLERVVLPETLKAIDRNAFRGCTSLQEVNIPAGTVTVGAGAFDGCSSLLALSFPATLTSFEPSAVSGCDSLTKIEVAPENTMFSSRNGILYDKRETNMILVPASLGGEVEIPEQIEALRASAFKGTNITSVSIPAGVTVIGEQCFANCFLLETVTIADGSRLTTFSDYCFSDCSSLTSIVIPEQVVYIGFCAFAGCHDLTRAQFAVTSGWEYSMPTSDAAKTPISEERLRTETSAAQTLIHELYSRRIWTRN